MSDPLWEYLREGCGTCEFWLRHDGNPDHPQGQCRRYPPQIIMEKHQGSSLWSMEQHRPWTAQDDWCGEYKRRNTE